MGERIEATPAALQAIRHVETTVGPVVLFQSGGCCDGSLPLCLPEGDLPIGPGDLLLGRLLSTPFYVDAEQYRRWGEPEFLLDVSPGDPEGFSLAAGAGQHFISRSPA